MSCKFRAKLDHLVVGAATLDEGVAYVEQKLGVVVPYGGIHPGMGTHNHLVKLGEEIFLEIIAVNPDSRVPDRPRWFSLDEPGFQNSLRKSPRLVTWVVNTMDIFERVKDAACSFGTPEILTRGHLSWQFALPADGRLLGGGMLPYIIQWQTSEHPATGMADVGLRLISLTAYHAHPVWFEKVLASIGAEKVIEIREVNSEKKQSLEAVISTPLGERTLSSYLI